MYENIEKAVPTEESPKTKESETSAPAATDNVVLYPCLLYTSILCIIQDIFFETLH